jgi:RNA polymerase sigma factor (sigma-70 family)
VPITEVPLKELLMRAKVRDMKAEDELCRRFLPLVCSLVASRDRSNEDLKQEAQMAVLKAVREYDPTKGTFAWLAERRIKDALNRASRSEPEPHDDYAEEWDEDDEADPTRSPTAVGVARMVHRSWDQQDHGSYGIWQGAAKDLRVAISRTLCREDEQLLGRLFALPGHERATQKDIATELEVSQQAVSKRVNKVVKRLEKADWREIWWQRLEEDPLGLL